MPDFSFKMHQIQFRSSQCSPRPLSWISGRGRRGRGGEGKRIGDGKEKGDGKKRGREGKGEGKGKGKGKGRGRGGKGKGGGKTEVCSRNFNYLTYTVP